MHVAALVFGFDDLDSLSAGDGARFFRVVFKGKTGEGFPDDQAHIHGLAVMLAQSPAGAIQHHDVIWMVENDGARQLVGNHFAVIGVRERDFL